ncbi:hypothetical protein D3C81_1887100 [compost metagenome]
MFDQVGAVLVVVVVGDIQPYFVNFRSPAQKIAPIAVFQAPGLRDLVERMQRLAFDARGLALIDVVALHQ